MKTLPRLLFSALLSLPAPPATAVVWPAGPGTDVVGALIHDRLRTGDRLVDMARMHNIGHLEIRLANPDLDPWLPHPGAEVLIPQLHVLPDGPRDGIVINLSERRLYYFADTWPDRTGPVVSTHPVGVGLIDRATPVIEARVTARVDDPAWYPTPEVRAWYRREKNEMLPAVVPPGPENPLGAHALILNADGLLIHGTHRPAGVGMRVSQGCIRLYPESIANLIQQVPVGTPVRIVNQPFRLGWKDDVLLLEIDPAGNDDTAIAAAAGARRHSEEDWERLRTRIEQAAGGSAAVDWSAARAVFERADSVPAPVARRDGGG